jgi:hypothetical protein
MEIENFLPPYSRIKITSGVDRYGFSSVLAKRLNLRLVPRSFANWVHGWAWWTEHTAELLACSDLPKDTSIIVNNKLEQSAMITEGFMNTIAGGLPFSYVAKQHNSRNENALLVIPPHSAEPEGGELKVSQEDYFDYIESIKHDFEEIYISIHYLDLNTPMYYAALRRGFKVIQGANPFDSNGLVRVRSLLDRFKYVTSNTMGSHMLYSLYADCNFSFCGPFFSFPAEGSYSDEKYIRHRFPKFFLPHPRMGLKNMEFAVEAIGERFILKPDKIREALGWTMHKQINGYLSGGARKVHRYYKKIFL